MTDHQGSVAERSKALVLGTSLFGGVGSNPTAAKGFATSFIAGAEWSWGMGALGFGVWEPLTFYD